MSAWRGKGYLAFVIIVFVIFDCRKMLELFYSLHSSIRSSCSREEAIGCKSVAKKLGFRGAKFRGTEAG